MNFKYVVVYHYPAQVKVCSFCLFAKLDYAKDFAKEQKKLGFDCLITKVIDYIWYVSIIDFALQLAKNKAI